MKPLRSHLPHVLPALIVIAASTATVAQSPAELPAIEPDGETRVQPCCHSIPEDPWPFDKMSLGDEDPQHNLLDRSTIDEYKTRAIDHPGAPRARGVDRPTTAEGVPFKDALPVPAKTPRKVTTFPGLDRNSARNGTTRFFPPDTIVAASETLVLEAANSGLRLTNRQGGAERLRSLNAFFGETGPSLFDPRVFYDRLSRRYFILATARDGDRERSWLFLSVSRRPEPQSLEAPQDWCNYRFDSRRVSAWTDFPMLGMNERFLAISDNHFSFAETRFRGSFLWVLEKDVLADNAAACPESQLFKFSTGRDAAGSRAASLQPAQHYSRTDLPGTPLFLVSSQPLRFEADGYTLWRLEDRGAGKKPRLRRALLRSEQPYMWPPEAEQRSGIDLETGDPRIQHVAYRDGVLWAVHTTGCNLGRPTNQSCVRALEIVPDAGGAAITFEETFGGGSGWHYWMPGVAINGLGDVVMVFQRSRFNRALGAAFTGKRPGEGSFGRVLPLRNGSCPLTNVDRSGRNRTGDYVGAQADPADDAGFWIAGEVSATSGGGCGWSTWVVRVRY